MNPLQPRENLDRQLARNIQTALRDTVKRSGDLVKGKDVSIWLVDGKKDRDIIYCCASDREASVYVGKGYSRRKKKGRYQGLTAWVFGEGRPLRLNNVADSREVAKKCPNATWTDLCGGYNEEQRTSGQRVRPMLAVPIYAVESPTAVIGVLRLGCSKDFKPFSVEHERILTLFAGQLSFVISYALRREKAEQLLASLFKDIGSIPSRADLLRRAVEEFPALFAGSVCSVLMQNEENLFDLVESSAAHLRALIGRVEPYSSGEGKTGKVVATKSAIIEEAPEGEVLKSARPPNECEVVGGVASFIAAPLFDGGRKVIGVIRSARGRGLFKFTEGDRDLLDLFAKQISYLLSIIAVGPFFPSRRVYDLLERFKTPQTRVVTVLYLDLRGFTAFASHILEGNAKQIVETLNCFFNVMVPVIYAHGGTIDKYEGDGLIALFNAYTDCEKHTGKSVFAALKMRDCYNVFVERFLTMQRDRFGRVIDRKHLQNLGVKIGITTSDDVIVGAVGATEFSRDDQIDSRVEFTMIGHDINLAARLVSDVPRQIEDRQPAHSETLILITHETWRQLSNSIFEFRRHNVSMRGAGPENNEERYVYEVLSLARSQTRFRI